MQITIKYEHNKKLQTIISNVPLNNIIFILKQLKKRFNCQGCINFDGHIVLSGDRSQELEEIMKKEDNQTWMKTFEKKEYSENSKR